LCLNIEGSNIHLLATGGPNVDVGHCQIFLLFLSALLDCHIYHIRHQIHVQKNS
jgi:hypothetical protein